MTTIITDITVTNHETEIIFHFKDESGQWAKDIRIPIDNFIPTALKMWQLALAIQARRQEGPPERRGEWERIAFFEWHEIEVQPLPMQSTPAVGMIFDPGTPTQIAFALSPAEAIRIAGLLVDRAGQYGQTPLRH